MNVLSALLPAAIAGLVSGMVFYGGLYLTVIKGLNARRPALLFLSSFLGRVAFVLFLLFFAMNGNAINVVPFMITFITARFLMERFTLCRQPSSARKGGPS